MQQTLEGGHYTSKFGPTSLHQTEATTIRAHKEPNIASLRDCRQQFSFQLWWSIAQGSESDAVALIQSRSLSLSWHGCLLMTVNFISPLIKRTSSQPSVLPSDAGWEMLSPGIKLRGIQSDLFSPDLYKRRRKRKKKYSAMQYVRAMHIYRSLTSQHQTWKHAPLTSQSKPKASDN